MHSRYERHKSSPPPLTPTGRSSTQPKDVHNPRHHFWLPGASVLVWWASTGGARIRQSKWTRSQHRRYVHDPKASED